MKNTKKVISLILSSQMLFSLSAVNVFADNNAVSLDDIVLENEYSENIQLPTETADGKAITWKSEDTSVIFISEGTAYVLPGLAKKQTKLTAKTDDDEKRFNVNVAAFEYTGTPLFEEDFELQENETLDSEVWRADAAQMPNTSDENGANYMGIASDMNDNHVYMIKRTDNSVNGANKSYIHINTELPSNSRIIYEADVRVQNQPANSAGKNIFANYWLCGSAGNTIGKYSAYAAAYIGGASGIQIKEPAGSQTAKVSSDNQIWQNIKFDITSASGVFDAYVDDNKVAENFALRATGAAAVKHLAFGLDGNTSGELWLDNVKYYICPKDAEEVLKDTGLGTENPDAVKDDITVPSVSGITWISSNPEIVSPDGSVHRENVCGTSEEVQLYGLLNDCGMVSAKEYTLTVLSDKAEGTDEAKALENLTIPSSFEAAFELPQKSGDVAFEWTSDNENAVFINGTKAYVVPGFLPAKAKLTATVKTQDGSLSKNFDVSVPAKINGSAFVEEDFESTNSGSLPETAVAEGNMWNRRNAADTFGVSVESAENANSVLRLNAGEYAVLFFDGATKYNKTYITYSTKTEGNPIANIYLRDGRDVTPRGGHQIVNLLEGLYKGTNEFLYQGATNKAYIIDDNKWYDVALEIDNQDKTARFFVKKSTDYDYSLVINDAPYQNYVPSKLVMGFDSGAGSIVFDNFKVYASNASVNAAEALMDAAMSSAFVKSDDKYIANDNITLPSIDGYTLIWKSEDEAIITNDGIVTKPEAGAGFASTTLRAVLIDASGNAVLNKSYNISVSPKLDDAQAVDEDAKALDISGIRIESKIDEMVDSGINGSNISWTSNHPEILSSDGTVTRLDKDTVVDITAVISKGSDKLTKNFTILIPQAEEKDLVSFSSHAYAAVRKGRGGSWKTNIVIDPKGDTANDRHGYIVFKADPNAFDGKDIKYSLNLKRTASDGDEASSIEIHAIPNYMIAYIDETINYQEAIDRELYGIDNLIAAPTLIKGTENYVDITDYVKSQIGSDDVEVDENGQIEVAFKLSGCTGKAIVIEGASATLVEERSYAESNVMLRVLDDSGNEIETSNGSTTAKVNVFGSVPGGNKKLYLAVYNADGALINAELKNIDLSAASQEELSTNAGIGNKVKAFLWDDNMVPVK